MKIWNLNKKEIYNETFMKGKWNKIDVSFLF